MFSTRRSSQARCAVAVTLSVIASTLACGKPPPARRKISMVTSAIVFDACPSSKQLNPKLAKKEIEELIGPCTTVPGGAAHFSATLLPGGRVELASPSGDPAMGVVPTCLMQTQKQLKHRLRLAKPCKFDVKLEERRADR